MKCGCQDDQGGGEQSSCGWKGRRKRKGGFQGDQWGGSG